MYIVLWNRQQSSIWGVFIFSLLRSQWFTAGGRQRRWINLEAAIEFYHLLFYYSVKETSIVDNLIN